MKRFPLPRCASATAKFILVGCTKRLDSSQRTAPMWRNGRRNGLKIRWAVKGPCRFESGHRQFRGTPSTRNVRTSVLPRMSSDRRSGTSDRGLAILLALGAAVVVVHLLTGERYGFHRDELATLDDARHLAWGYV